MLFICSSSLLQCTLKQLNCIFIDIYQVKQEIGHSSVVMTEKYARFNLRKLKDDFPSIADKIDARLTPPADDTYFTNLLGGI